MRQLSMQGPCRHLHLLTHTHTHTHTHNTHTYVKHGTTHRRPPPQGWHYELDAPGEALSFKGVVFNEMKGVYSSPDSMFYR